MIGKQTATGVSIIHLTRWGGRRSSHLAHFRLRHFRFCWSRVRTCRRHGCRRFDPVTPTTAVPRHAHVSNISSPAGRSSSSTCSDPSHQMGWHICPGNLRLDPHIAPRLSPLLPVSW